MRAVKHYSFPLLRCVYSNLDELAEVINRSRVTVFRKLAYDEFTDKDKDLIAKDLIRRGKAEDKDQAIQTFFGGKHDTI